MFIHSRGPALAPAEEQLENVLGPYWTMDEIRSPHRYKNLVHKRRVVAFVLRQMGFSFPEIGRIINRHHTTVMHLLGRKD